MSRVYTFVCRSIAFGRSWWNACSRDQGANSCRKLAPTIGEKVPKSKRSERRIEGVSQPSSVSSPLCFFFFLSFFSFSFYDFLICSIRSSRSFESRADPDRWSIRWKSRDNNDRRPTSLNKPTSIYFVERFVNSREGVHRVGYYFYRCVPPSRGRGFIHASRQRFVVPTDRSWKCLVSLTCVLSRRWNAR